VEEANANYYTTDAVQDYLEKQTFLKSMKIVQINLYQANLYTGVKT
jgi:hypothetical protein